MKIEIADKEKCIYCREYGNFPCEECDRKLAEKSKGMSRLEEIKNEYAKQKGFTNWESFRFSKYVSEIELDYNEIITIYCKECCEKTLEEASINGELKSYFLNDNNKWIEITNGNFQFNPNNYAQKYEINKETITNPDNIVIL